LAIGAKVSNEAFEQLRVLAGVAALEVAEALLADEAIEVELRPRIEAVGNDGLEPGLDAELLLLLLMLLQLLLLVLESILLISLGRNYNKHWQTDLP
jgi:hypothetical protein